MLPYWDFLQARWSLCYTQPTKEQAVNVWTAAKLCVIDDNRINSTVSVKKIPPWGLVAIFPKRLGIFQPNFICLLCVRVYVRLQIFIQLPAILTKLCHIKCDHPVHTVSSKCPPSVKTHTGIFWRFFPSSWEFLVQILRAYHTFLSMPEYTFLFNCLQL